MTLRSLSHGASSFRPVALRLNLRTHRNWKHPPALLLSLLTTRLPSWPNSAVFHTHTHTKDHLCPRPQPKLLSVSDRNSLPRLYPMATVTKSETRARAHSHHHHHDNSYLVSKNKQDPGVRITRYGLYTNLAMAVVKGVGGYAFNSQAMVADAWHSLTDLASDVLTLATVSWSLKPPTTLFPTGFGKVESLGSLGVSGMLLFGGCFMCFNSCEILYAHFFLDAHAAAEAAAHSHGHSHGGGAPSLHAAWLALATILVKEWLYQASKLLSF